MEVDAVAATPSPLYNTGRLKWDVNGPSSQCKETIKSLKWAISKDIPIFGICLGNQLPP